VTGRSVPVHLPKHLLFAMLAYRIQADAFGDLDAGMVQILKATVGSAGSAMITKLTTSSIGVTRSSGRARS
jgi:hypothetical protein